MKWTVLGMMAAAALTAQDEVVFRSDTTLVRVDVQVLDRDNRPVSGLEREAFLFREQGQLRAIKNFVREEMPIDLLFLIDVSRSMRPHVERMADAAHQSLPSLRKDDRVSIMVFDQASRLRMPFRSGPKEAEREFDNLLRAESFNGGTDITRGLLDAAQYLKRNGRKEARRAIVLLTDDQTQFEPEEDRVVDALRNADTVMSVLLVPDAMQTGRRGNPGGGYPPRQGGGRRGGGLGGVIIGGGIPGVGGIPGGGGRRGPTGGGYPGGGGGQYPGGGQVGGPRTHSAGSAQIARESGGDSMQADESAALETTLNRLRQRYALYFNLPAGVVAGDRRTVDVALEDSVKRQYPEATIRYRHYYIAAASSGSGAPVEETLEVVPMRPETKTAPPVSRKRTMDGSSSSSPGIIVH